MTTAIVVGLAVLVSNQQQPLYQASARVLLKHQNLASGLAGIQDISPVERDPVRNAQTQTQIAMSPAVARRVARMAEDPDVDAASFLDHANVTAEPDSDILNFRVTYPDEAVAARLATIHAQAFIAHRQQLDTAPLVAARRQLRGRIEQLQAGEFRNSTLVPGLVETEQQLRTLEALQTANASLLRAATGAIQVQPKSVRNALLGVVLGLMLGIGLALGLDALDTRIRSSLEIAARLDLPLLARLAAPPKKSRSKGDLVMLTKPNGPRAEAFRMLRSNLDFVNLDRGARSIMVSSALEREGKSTTVANLAIALARGGRRVALVDLDLRQPVLDKFFKIERSQPGVTGVILGRTTLQGAIVDIFGKPSESQELGVSPSDNGGAAAAVGVEGCLHVLAAGTTPSDPGEFVSSPRLGTFLEEISDAYDIVLIDTPPLLAFGDAMALSSKVDALIVVTRLPVIKRSVLEELGRALTTCPTVKLGFVVTGAEADQVVDYRSNNYHGRGYGYDVRRASTDADIEERVL